MEEAIVILLCVALNGLLAYIEMAFVSVGRPCLRQLARQGNTEAQRILSLLDSPERTLSVIQIGITVVAALGAAVSGAGAEEWISPILERRFEVSENTAEAISIVLVVLPLTYLTVALGELVPKTIALRDPLSIALKAAKWLLLMDRVLAPLVTAFEWSTKKVMLLFPRRTKMDGAVVQTTSGEVVAEQLDQLSQQTRDYVLNLVNIEKKRVKDIYLPWDQVISVDTSQPFSEVESVIVSSGHTLTFTHM